MQSSKVPAGPDAHSRMTQSFLLTVTEKPAQFHQDSAALLPWMELWSAFADLLVVALDPDEYSSLADWGCGETRVQGAAMGIPVRNQASGSQEVGVDEAASLTVGGVVGLGANEEGVISKNSSLEIGVAKGR
jgi:hypothetical protein